ncbi:protein trichome birefringence-like 14 isoform X2 [Tasmannia lanceolata]|uniref:protein trichome birefringence-like 14 isoform X2 n=1 Tax=Tasmannia lanceolata TaxID=3420 RepID=UPI004063729E
MMKGAFNGLREFLIGTPPAYSISDEGEKKERNMDGDLSHAPDVMKKNNTYSEEDFSHAPEVRAPEVMEKKNTYVEEDFSHAPEVTEKNTYVEEDFSHAPEVGEKKNNETEQESDSLPPSSKMTSSHEETNTDEDLITLPTEKKECNYAKGKWVADSRRPLYSGFGCKQWLSEMWACRLTQRTDFSYEGFRWQPENCEMPDFEGSIFLKRMQDKTLGFIGDSLGRQQFQSLMCMITGGKESPEVEDVGWKYGLVKARGAVRPDGWAYRFPSTNTTILYYWSASLCELEPLNTTDPATQYAMHLDRPATFLCRYLHSFDVLVLNTGHHWNRGKLKANRWVMYAGGMPNKNRALAGIGAAKNFTVYSVVKWLDSQLPKHPRLKAFFRTISPRHFVNGEWNSGGSCDNTTPLAGGNQVLQDKSSDPDAEGAVEGTGVKLLDITALSQLRDECHKSRYSIKSTQGVQDCLHWCLPGVPDTWNEILFAQL